MTIKSRIGQSGESQRSEALALALESQLPLDTVLDLYEDECAKLEVAARVKSFLPIFAIRNVRDRLNRVRIPR
jgi:hypothetical protein